MFAHSNRLGSPRGRYVCPAVRGACGRLCHPRMDALHARRRRLGQRGGKADYTVYFYTRFSKPLECYGVWSAEFPEGMGRKLENVTSPEFAEAVRRAKVTERPDRMEGDHLGFYTEFPHARRRTGADAHGHLLCQSGRSGGELQSRIEGKGLRAVLRKRRLRCGTRPCRKSKSPEGRKMSARFFILRCTTR